MAEMTSRERVMAALNHEEPDRVPLDIGGGSSTTLLEETYDRLKEYLGISAPTRIHNKSFRLVRLDEEVMVRLGSDLRPVGLRAPKKWKPRESNEPGTYYDILGIKWKQVPYPGGYYYEGVGHPLAEATISDLDSYPWPDPDDSGWTDGMAEEVRDLYENTPYALLGDSGFKGFWEQGYLMRGYVQLSIDLKKNPEFVHALFERLLELNVAFAKKFLEITGSYLVAIRTSDDLATQQGPFMSKKMYREMIWPYQKRYYTEIKKYTDAKIFYHTCGNISDLVGDLIEAGVEALNPFQVSAIPDPAGLKAKYGDKMTFWGGIDTQHVLPHGTPEDVKEEVRLRIRQLGKGGGYVVASVHAMQPDVPPENIIAMAEATKEFGTYPIR